ncbi:hypothetical protein [Brevundimonas diminuta]|uniref:hypothetical protein n=1 Tax=Brevundimonas diminuta TaxID=293 RepID=UPI003D9A0F05
MSRRYRYSTCLSFGTDGEADYCEMEVTVSFAVAWGEPETGPTYACGGTPATGDLVEDIRVETIDGDPPTNRVLAAMILDMLDGTTDFYTREMLAEAIAVEADAAEYHALLRRGAA